jgi:hypothetical protein
MQLFVDPRQELMRTLAAVKIEELTPMAAFELLRQWKEKYGK